MTAEKNMEPSSTKESNETTTESSNVGELVVRYAGEDSPEPTLRVYVSPEKELSDDELNAVAENEELPTLEEIYSWLDIEDPDEITPEMMMQMYKVLLGFKSDKEVIEYTIRLGEYLKLVPKKIKEISESAEQNGQELIVHEILSLNPPTKYIMSKTKAMNTLVNPAVTPVDGESSVEFFVQNGNATLKMALNFDKHVEIQSKDHMRFTPYDREVFNGICSRYENDNDTFTAEQIYRTINGLSNRETVSETSIKRINDSINKMIGMRVTIDYTEEMRKNKKIDDLQEYIQEDYMIPAKKATLTFNNKTVNGYKLHAKPLMYDYSQISKQIITVPLKILNTKDGTSDDDSINNSPEITVIRAHLIREIEWIKAEMKKKHPKRNNKIALENIYELLELDSPPKKKALKIREHISKILNNFVNKKYIKGYETYKKGRTIMGFQIAV